MSVNPQRRFVIGDVHGCLPTLKQLLASICFNPSNDRLIFVGDLLGRGRWQLETVAYVEALGSAAAVVLGNHDLHGLAHWLESGAVSRNGYSHKDLPKRDMSAGHVGMAFAFLAKSPFLVCDAGTNALVCHAGIAPQLTFTEAQQLAEDLSRFREKVGMAALLDLFINEPCCDWNRAATVRQRLGFAVTSCTRMKFCRADGSLDLRFKGAPGTQPAGLVPWFERPLVRTQASQTIIFGHWAALGHWHTPDAVCCDTGCVYGGYLTAVELAEGFPATSVKGPEEGVPIPTAS